MGEDEIECSVEGCGYKGNFRGFTSHTIASHRERNEELRKQMLIGVYKDTIGDVEQSPKFEEIKSELPFTKRPIYELFDSYENFVEEVGIKYHKFTKEEIIEELKRISEKELGGKRPTTFDIREKAYFTPETVQEYFGTMNSAFENAGFKDIHYMNVSKERLIDEIHIVSKETDGKITSGKMRKEGIFSPHLFRERFGSWNKAVKEAGYEPIPYRPSGEDNPMYGKTGEEHPSYGNRGEDNPNYIHGSPGEYHASPVYRENRREAMKRAEGICEHPDCTKRESKHGIDLDCHHIIPARLFNSEEERHKLDNLIILCREHHAEVEPAKRTKVESEYLI